MADPVAQIIVNVYADGRVTVQGPLHVKQWCINALRVALAQVQAYVAPVLPDLPRPSDEVN